MIARPGGSSSKWCLRAKISRLSRPLVIKGPFPQRAKKCPGKCSTTIRSEDHFWHFQEELLSDVSQLPNEGIHALNTCITTLITQCKFPHPKTQEMLKITVLQHAIGFHEGTGSNSKTSSSWPIRPFSPTASCSSPNVSSMKRPKRRAGQTSPLSPQWPSQHYLSINIPYPPSQSAANVTIPTPQNKCLPQGKECFNCSGQNHYTVLCRQSQRPLQSSCSARSAKCIERSPRRETRPRHNITDNRCTSSWSPSRCSSDSPSHCPSHSPSPICPPGHPDATKNTPFQYHKDRIEVIPAPSQPTV